jgi:hypothetical protein
VFDIPTEKNSELNLVLKSGQIAIITGLCEKNAEILKLVIYELGQNREYDVLKPLLIKMWGSSDSVWPCLVKVMTVLPDLIAFVGGILPEVPKTADPSSFIRFMAHNCTIEEVSQLTHDLLFPSAEAEVVALVKDSLRWKPIAQSLFWVILRKAYLSEAYSELVVNAIRVLISEIVESPVASVELKFLLNKMMPSPEVWLLILELLRGAAVMQVMVASILENWIDLFEKQTEMFVQERVAVFRSFYEGLSSEHRANFPVAVKGLIFES